MKLKFFLIFSIIFFSLDSYANDHDAIIVENDTINSLDKLAIEFENALQKIEELSSENKALKSIFRDSQNEIEQKAKNIEYLEKKIEEINNVTIKRLEASNDSLQRWLITMASYTLFVPYDKILIERIAIPAFKAAREGTVYSLFQNRLILLENYRNHLQTIIDYLEVAEKNISKAFTKETRAQQASLSNEALSTLPLFLSYQTYNEWGKTYLGQQIIAIKEILKTPSENTPSLLKDIRMRLECLLTN